MPLLSPLQRWFSGPGPRLQVVDLVPATDPIRQWADAVPWAALVAAVDKSVAKRFPKTSNRGRRPVATRVLLALELLKHEMGASDEHLCHRLHTDFAVMYACGITEVHATRRQSPVVRPQTLAQFRSRMDEALRDDLIAIQAATAMVDGRVSPAHLLVDPFPAEQGNQRDNDANTI